MIFPGYTNFLEETFDPNGMSSPALELYTCLEVSKYILGPGVR